MDWATFFTAFGNLFILPFGNVYLAGLFLMVAVLYMGSRLGLGGEGLVFVVGGFALLFSVWLLPTDLTAVIVMVLAAIFALGVLRLWRK